MRRSALLAMCWFVVQTFVSGQSTSQSEIEADLVKVRALMKGGKFEAAKAALLATLEAHEGDEYFRMRREEIEEEMRRCAFRISHPPKKLADLVSGKLISDGLNGGKLKIQYGDDTRDFSGDDFKFHPAIFNGGYSVEISGDHYPTLPIRVVCCLTADSFLAISFGRAQDSKNSGGEYYPARIARSSKGKDSLEVLDEKDTSPCKAGRPFKVRVVVGESDVRAIADGKMLFAQPRPKGIWGSVGISRGMSGLTTIEGKAEPAWLQGLADQADTEALVAFRKTYDPKKDLPAWVYAKATKQPKAKVVESASEEPTWPESLEGRAHADWRRVSDLLDKGKYDTAADELGRIDPKSLPLDARSWLEGLAEQGRGREAKALEAMERVVAANPRFLDALNMRADLLESLGRIDEAIAAYRAILAIRPIDTEANIGLIIIHVRAGRIAEAKVVLDEFAKHGVRDPEIAALAAMVRKSERGPEWTRLFEQRSEHYQVFSDIDRATCLEATQVLEQAHQAYEIYVRSAPAARRWPFKVYIFSGEAGYSQYVAGVLGVLPTQTAGLYSPFLKQLLIWNLPDHLSMLRTVRHEGFHQYLDSIVNEAPVWFDEGHAEYFETAASGVGSSWKPGEVRSDHLAVLKKEGLIDLDSFLHVTRSSFCGAPDRHYAQGWALVHFMRHGKSRTARDLMEKLFTLLAAEASSRVALEKALTGIDLKALGAEFAAYVEGL